MDAESAPTLRVSSIFISSKSARKLESGNLHLGVEQYRLLGAENGTLQQSFMHPIELSSSCKLQISVTYMKTRFSLSKETQSIPLNTQNLFTTAQTGAPQVSVAQGELQITFLCEEQRALDTIPSALPESSATLHPTTDGIFQECDRFRVLVIGKSGVGKSTLINIAFGINKAHASDLFRGNASIEEGLISPTNPRLILHDSMGFEPGDEDKYGVVKTFIGTMKDRLHAVLLCMETPNSGGRLLEAAIEDFLRSKQGTLGSIPLIIVFTKYDSLVNELTMKKIDESVTRGDGKNARKLAQKDAESLIRKKRVPSITKLMGERPSVATVSKTVTNLVRVIHGSVSGNEARDACNAHVASVITTMAQRVDPSLKARGTMA